MADYEQIRLQAETGDHKPLFFLGMLRVIDHQSIGILEHSCGFCERDPVFF